MATGAAIGPQVVVGAGVRVEAASGTEHLTGPKKIYGTGTQSVLRIRDVYTGSGSA
jgi:hypothetical protein